MKSQVAAEAVGAATLARGGWRPRAGCLKLVFVADEETGGDVGAHWLTDKHPDRVRCDMLLNEGAGDVFECDGGRRYGVCCAEKGIFRFKLTARGVAGHASLPRTGDNALLKLAPALQLIADAQPTFELTEAPAALLAAASARTRTTRRPRLRRIAAADPRLLVLVEPMLGVTLTPTMAHASDKINVIPSRAYLKVDCRVPPGLGEDAARRRIESVLGDEADKLEIEFTETVTGNESPVAEPADGRDRPLGQDQRPRRRDRAGDPSRLLGLALVPRAFPECVAYGFFPQRHMTLLETAPLVHSADERIDVRDLGFAASFYTDMARELLG